MQCTRAERVFEQLKKFLSSAGIWQKVSVPQYDLLNRFGTPTTKLKMAQKMFVPLSQLYNDFHTPNIDE